MLEHTEMHLLHLDLIQWTYPSRPANRFISIPIRYLVKAVTGELAVPVLLFDGAPSSLLHLEPGGEIYISHDEMFTLVPLAER